MRYVFFRILAWKLRDAEDPTPVLAASLATALLLFFNSITLTMIVNAWMHRPLVPSFPGGHTGLGAGLLVMMVIAHKAMTAAWVDDGGYSKLLREFSPDPVLERRRTALFWSYVVFSIVLPTGLAIFVPRVPPA